MKMTRSMRYVEAGVLSPKLLAGALAQAGLLAAVFSMPVCAATLAQPAKQAVAPALEPLLYIAQASSGYGNLHSGSGTSSTQSGTASGTATRPVRPQESGTPAPKPAPVPDSRNSTR